MSLPIAQKTMNLIIVLMLVWIGGCGTLTKLTIKSIQKQKEQKNAERKQAKRESVTRPCVDAGRNPYSEKALSVAVMDFVFGQSGTAENGTALADVCRHLAQQNPHWNLLDREHVLDILGETDFAAAVACDKTKCVVEYGKLLSVQVMMYGRISAIGSSYIVHLSLTDVETAKVISTQTQQVDSDMDTLVQTVADMCCQMLVNR